MQHVCCSRTQPPSSAGPTGPVCVSVNHRDHTRLVGARSKDALQQQSQHQNLNSGAACSQCGTRCLATAAAPHPVTAMHGAALTCTFLRCRPPTVASTVYLGQGRNAGWLLRGLMRPLRSTSSISERPINLRIRQRMEGVDCKGGGGKAFLGRGAGRARQQQYRPVKVERHLPAGQQARPAARAPAVHAAGGMLCDGQRPPQHGLQHIPVGAALLRAAPDVPCPQRCNSSGGTGEGRRHWGEGRRGGSEGLLHHTRHPPPDEVTCKACPCRYQAQETAAGPLPLLAATAAAAAAPVFCGPGILLACLDPLLLAGAGDSGGLCVAGGHTLAGKVPALHHVRCGQLLCVTGGAQVKNRERIAAQRRPAQEPGVSPRTSFEFLRVARWRQVAGTSRRCGSTLSIRMAQQTR